jgi:hypothetical protein
MVVGLLWITLGLNRRTAAAGLGFKDWGLVVFRSSADRRFRLALLPQDRHEVLTAVPTTP